jgi:hypothetical protein
MIDTCCFVPDSSLGAVLAVMCTTDDRTCSSVPGVYWIPGAPHSCDNKDGSRHLPHVSPVGHLLLALRIIPAVN